MLAEFIPSTDLAAEFFLGESDRKQKGDITVPE